MLEFQDLQLAYDQGSRKTPDPAKNKGWRDGNHAVNPTVFPEFAENPSALVSTGKRKPDHGHAISQLLQRADCAIRGVWGQFKDLSYAFDNQTALEVNPNFPTCRIRIPIL